MIFSPRRRTLLFAVSSLPFATACSSWAKPQRDSASAQDKLARLEATFGGRLGLFALDTSDDAVLAYRAAERFPLCSTFKLIAAAGILSKSLQAPGLPQKRLHYRQSDLVTYSPVTEKFVAFGMTVDELCAAAIQYSDNTAGNLLIKMLGGPGGVTAFAHSLGDTAFRLDRWETALNTAIPGDARDTSTPEAMARSLQKLALGSALPQAERMHLQDWLKGNTTGAARIKAGVPADWGIGDKTGTGDYGTANDIAVLWPPERKPIVLAIYTTRHEKDAEARSDVIAAAARIVVAWLR